MKTSVVSIGNSKGIRIPKVVLKELHIENEVDLSLEDNKLVIRPLKARPREGWDDAFKLMHQRGEDNLIVDETIDSQLEDWEWK